jgi:hypothetical protein
MGLIRVNIFIDVPKGKKIDSGGFGEFPYVAHRCLVFRILVSGTTIA